MTTQMPQSTEPAVRMSIVVDAPVERAFSVFTADIASWWPAEHHLLEAELAEMKVRARGDG